MAAFGAAILTQQGLNLIAKAQAGQAAIKFTKAAAGDGFYSDGEVLIGLTNLKSQRQEMPINEVAVVNDSTVYLKFVISNFAETQSLNHGYYVKEVGVFAEDPEEGEILYAIAVAVNDQWDYMPAYNGLHAATILMEFYTEVSNAAEVTIVSGSGAYALQEDLDALRSEFKSYVFEDTLDDSFYELFGGGSGGADTSMSRSEIMESINTEWNGESSSSKTAMSAMEVQESIDTKWDGSSSSSDTAMNKEEIEEATT